MVNRMTGAYERLNKAQKEYVDAAMFSQFGIGKKIARKGDTPTFEGALALLDQAIKRDALTTRLVRSGKLPDAAEALKKLPLPKPVKHRDRQGFVYLIQSPTGMWKIGRAADPQDRLKTFNVKLPFETEFTHLIQTRDMYKLEAQLHKRYRHARGNGEWFSLSDLEVVEICSIQVDPIKEDE